MIGPADRGRAGQPSKQKKPGMARRASSSVTVPHRGQDFSVDDDVNEMEVPLSGRPAISTTASSFGAARGQTGTVRRRPAALQTQLARVDSSPEEEEGTGTGTGIGLKSPVDKDLASERISQEEQPASTEDSVLDVGDEIQDEEDVDDDISDTESFTLKDRQQAINETHPFGIRIWKPALYKKDRSVQKTAEGDIHSSPGGRVDTWLFLSNLLWTLLFGWWLALVACAGAIVCFIFSVAPSAIEYGRVLWGLSCYLFYPFGKFVRLEQDEAYADEDEGEGRSVTEYEAWQNGDIEDGRLFFGPQGTRSIIGRRRDSMQSEAPSETDSLLPRHSRRGPTQGASAESQPKRRLFGRGQWNIGRVIFFLFFYGLITPLLFLVSGICWFLVFWIPMGRVTMLLFYHLRRHPLALSFDSDAAYSRSNVPNSSILLCTYRASGLKYWKYTVDGTNIFLINLMGVVLFVIFDYWILLETLEMKLFITHPAFLFIMALFSIIPLAYFIGQAVASISAQSSMGLGAAINAFFSTLVEVFLYCVALKQGKSQLVEGSIIGSIFAGILFLPGLSMCFGAIKRKTQRFNAKSAGVTSTMLLFAVIAAFGPTLFYQIYGTVSYHTLRNDPSNPRQHELNCLSCVDTDESPSRDCRRCYFSQVPALDDRFFIEAVRPYCWFAATTLFVSYIIGLWFTLRTHAAVIWNNEKEDEKKTHEPSLQPLGGAPNGRLQRDTSRTTEARGAEIRESQLYKRILGQSLKQAGLGPRDELVRDGVAPDSPRNATPHMVPPKSAGAESIRSIPGFTEAQNSSLVREVAEMAATAATIAARDAARHPRRTSLVVAHKHHTKASPNDNAEEAAVAEALAGGGGHDAPNWSRAKSSIILCGATILYALIAEILVNTVDVVLANVAIDEKFLGITLFALVPNTTEFLVSLLAIYLTLLTLSECHIFCHEWQHRAFHGDWLRICAASLLAPDTGSGAV